MATASLVRRICKCGCGQQFSPNLKRPGQQYLYVHKPKAVAVSVDTARAAPETRRRVLNYRLALDSAERELPEVEAEIEKLDDQAAELRQQIDVLLARKDVLVQRHLQLRTAIEQLSPLAKEEA